MTSLGGHFIKCGDCAGCKIEASVKRQIDEVNAYFGPALTESSRRVGRALDEERGLPRDQQHRTNAAYRQLRETQGRHWRWCCEISKHAAFAGCVRLKILVPAAVSPDGVVSGEMGAR